MIRMRVRVEGDLLNMVSEVRERSRAADAAMKGSMDVIAKQLKQPLQRDLMALTPGPAKRPIQWTSDSQRRYVMWKMGKEGRLGGKKPYPPYRRKKGRDSLMGQWRIRKYVSKTGILLTAGNDSPVYKFVAEDPDNVSAWQRFHRNTGWPSALKTAEVFAVYSDIAATEISDDWFQYWDGVLE